MNIILEGPDGSGKSTLAEYLAPILNMQVQPSEGPPKFPGEIHERIARYERLKNTIFDRHPVVSQIIYGHFRTNTVDLPTVEETANLYLTRPIIVYCRATDLSSHVLKGHDTVEHIQMVEANNHTIVQLYDRWAAEHANLIYRIGESMFRIRATLQGAIKG